jgi:A/G-specific adenine glycosylase
MNAVFTEKLLDWNNNNNKRSMPWKGEKDPYKIWLSEIILQQTRVEQGLSYYQSFITNFPTVYDLAKAPDEKVFKLWEGLGYYSRCKNLIASAKFIVNDLNGKFPDTFETIVALKGVGPYTASAIASFAFNQPYAVVDGNVQRVLSRYFGISTPVDTSAGKKLYQHLAESLLDINVAGLYNQAIMDFGAIICKPQNPLCTQCPQQEPSLKKWMALQAKELFEKALAINPGSDSLKIGLGSCYLFGNISDNPMQGISLIREVASRDSTNMYAQFMLGMGGLVSGQLDLAIQRLLKVARYEPNNAEAVLALADAFERKNDKVNAIMWYEKGKELIGDPDFIKEIDQRISLLKT